MTTYDQVPEPGRHGRAGAEELLYDTERTRVLRLRLADREPVIVKELRGPRAAARLRHEEGILRRLAGVDGAPPLADGVGRPGAIVVEDMGGRSVAAAAAQTRFGVAELVTFGVALARVVAKMHRRGVIHRDVNPANIVVSDERPGQVQLIDFDLATTFAEERPAFTHQSQVTGTLPYLAPEQTGRTGRAVDQRADLYAVGATLYMLATGAPPFGDSDREPLDLIHAHLTRTPVPPAEVDPALPVALSAIILRLLEKEPDKRYQSADGLAYDLSRLKPDAAGRYPTFPLGESDFPMRLTPPSTLVGRDAEIGVLRVTFAAVAAGGRRTVLVTGAPGVGKTALIDELRPLVTAASGWFVSGKFDQYRRDADSNGLRQSLRGLGRLLLAEPEEHLTGHRSRILDALGANAGLIATLLPEFALLLDIAPDEHGPDDSADARVARAEIDLLRSIASPTRPVVIVLDDLQWAESTAIGLLDEVVMDDELSGVLVVGAYRDSEVDATHPLTGRLARWQRSAQPPVPLRLRNLPPADLGSLVSAMLRMPQDGAASLIDAVVSRTGGNPFDTVELINWLRREDALERADGQWRWDTGLIRGYLGRGDVTELLRERMDRLPPPTRTLLLIMACLGGAVTMDLLIAATGAKAEVVERDIAPALEDGLLVVDRAGEPAVRFRHDRVQQAAHDALDPADREEIHLLLARTLAAHPELAAVAAEQYLSAVSAVRDADERLRAASLFRVTAADVGLVNPAAAERFLAAAVDLVEEAGHRENALRIALRIDRHAALYRLGRLDEADGEYAVIERLCPLPLDRVDAACLQISSLSNRNRSAEALDLGLTLLRALGCAAPDGEAVGPGIGSGLEALYRWVERDEVADDPDRPEVTDPERVAVAKLINRSLPAAFFTGQPVMAWLALEAWRQWIEHGPCAPLVGPISHMSFVTIIVRQDHRTGYRVMRWILAAAEARGYEPQAAQSRFLFALGSGHWFDPLPDTIAQARHAHEILQRHGDLQNACCTYYTSTVQLLACAPTIDSFRADAEAGIAFGVRSGNDQATAAYLGYRQLGRALCGETDEVGGFDDADYSEATHRAELATNPTAGANYHATRALTALIFGDWAGHATNAAAAVALLPFIPSTFAELHARLAQSIALAMRAPGDGAEALAELQTHRDWLAGRADDAPHTYRHLLLWVDAERAAATGDPWGAVRTFEAALSEAGRTQQPLFTALIHERAAALHLGQGLEYTGRHLLAEARHGYAAWGAVAKVRELDRQHDFLRTVAPGRTGRTTSRTFTMTLAGEAIDLLGVLRASQALSSETNLDRLRDQVAGTLSAMTGAESVTLLLRNDETGDWVLSGDATGEAGARIPLAVAGQRGLLPVSPFRYAERTRQPLLVDDAGRDNRFAHDPYVAALDTCSLMVVPILARGVLRAMLILENRSSRGTFSQERLDAVMLIAGQLAVSLDNALLYASLEQKVVERTEALEAANRQLERLSATDTLTGLANRRQLEVILAAEWQNASRRQVPLAVAMVDVDHFKSYNDRYGHGAGDRCLRGVASVLNHHVRGEDTVARYGGEEFTIVLPSADAHAAYMVAERVRSAVAAMNEPHAGSAFGVVSISVGVAAAVPTVDTTPEMLIEQADTQLYEAKRGGRNRVAPSGSLGVHAHGAADVIEEFP